MTAPGEQIVAEIVSKTDTVLLGMNCGKDSIAAWLAIKPHFRRIVPYHMHLVPDRSDKRKYVFHEKIVIPKPYGINGTFDS